jgi:hypothetical protein
MSAFGGTLRGRNRSGLWTYRTVEKDADLAVRLTDLDTDGSTSTTLQCGLVLQTSLEDFAPAAMVFVEKKPTGGRPRVRFTSRTSGGWRGTRIVAPTGVVESAETCMRLVRRGKQVAGYYAGGENGTWRQVGMTALPSEEPAYAGMVATGGSVRNGEAHAARARGDLVVPGDSGLPMIEVKSKGKARRGFRFAAPATVHVHGAPDTTLEGEVVADGATRAFDCAEPLTLEEPGTYRLSVRSSRADTVTAVVTHTLDLGPPR